MKTLLTPTPLIAYEIPSDSKEIQLVYMFGLPSVLYRDNDDFGHSFSVVNEDVEIIATVDKGVIDFDCEPYLKCFETYGEDREYTYQYIKEGFIHHTCSKNKALIDLLESHSLSLDKKYLIIKPKN